MMRLAFKEEHEGKPAYMNYFFITTLLSEATEQGLIRLEEQSSALASKQVGGCL